MACRQPMYKSFILLFVLWNSCHTLNFKNIENVPSWDFYCLSKGFTALFIKGFWCVFKNLLYFYRRFHFINLNWYINLRWRTSCSYCYPAVIWLFNQKKKKTKKRKLGCWFLVIAGYGIMSLQVSILSGCCDWLFDVDVCCSSKRVHCWKISHLCPSATFHESSKLTSTPT